MRCSFPPPKDGCMFVAKGLPLVAEIRLQLLRNYRIINPYRFLGAMVVIFLFVCQLIGFAFLTYPISSTLTITQPSPVFLSLLFISTQSCSIFYNAIPDFLQKRRMIQPIAFALWKEFHIVPFPDRFVLPQTLLTRVQRSCYTIFQ